MKVEVGKFYKHYKNCKTYQVLAVAHHTETGEEMVVYQAQYDTDDLGPKPVFARPRNMFEEEVEHQGKRVERFQRLV